MARGRAKLEINANEFQDQVDRLEEQRVFANLSELWQAVTDTEWAKSQQPRPLTCAVAHQRAKELEIKTKTKAGRRGRPKGAKLSTEQKEAMQAGRKGGRAQKMKAFAATFREAKKELSDNVNIVEKAESGSLRAAIKGKCMQCTAEQRQEIRHCQVIGCLLYPHRPYQ